MNLFPEILVKTDIFVWIFSKVYPMQFIFNVYCLQFFFPDALRFLLSTDMFSFFNHLISFIFFYIRTKF